MCPKKHEKDSKRILLNGGILYNDNYIDRAETLFNHPDNTKEKDFFSTTYKILNSINTQNDTDYPDYYIENQDSFFSYNDSDLETSRVDKNFDIENSANNEKKNFKKRNKRKETIHEKTISFVINNAYDFVGRVGSRLLGGYETDQNLYMSFAGHHLNTPYANQHLVYNSINEIAPFLREFVADKVKKQLGVDYVDKIKGIFIDNNTETSKKLAKNIDVYYFIRKNKDFLKNYGYIKKDSIQFTDSNFFNSIGKADIIDMYLTKDNEIVFYIIDTYDFNKSSKNPFVRAGRKMQDNNKIIPYFIIYSVKIDKNTAKRYLR